MRYSVHYLFTFRDIVNLGIFDSLQGILACLLQGIWYIGNPHLLAQEETFQIPGDSIFFLKKKKQLFANLVILQMQLSLW